jgi:hypothetical protein
MFVPTNKFECFNIYLRMLMTHVSNLILRIDIALQKAYLCMVIG